MPNWQPNWKDVKWDHGAAADASRALRQAADRLQYATDVRVRAARSAQQEWRGRYRDEFDRDLEWMQRRARELIEQMRNKAKAIDDASQHAIDEQKKRERDRERWKEEKKREERKKKEQEEKKHKDK